MSTRGPGGCRPSVLPCTTGSWSGGLGSLSGKGKKTLRAALAAHTKKLESLSSYINSLCLPQRDVFRAFRDMPGLQQLSKSDHPAPCAAPAAPTLDCRVPEMAPGTTVTVNTLYSRPA